MALMRRIRTALGDLWWVDRNIRLRIRLSRFYYFKVPLIGRVLSALVDRSLRRTYGLDLHSFSVEVFHLSISHPVGVMLGGNGVHSDGRVVVMAGVKFGGTNPSDPIYLEKHARQRVFELGDNVVIAAGSVLLGPLTICDDVVIGAMSLVNKSITEPGVYVGTPAKKISDTITREWIKGMPVPMRRAGEP